MIPTKTAKASKEAPAEDSDSEETPDGREALAIFPDAKGAEADDAEEAAADGPDGEGDSTAAK